MADTLVTVEEFVTQVNVTEVIQIVEGVTEPTLIEVSGNSVVEVIEPGAVDVSLVTIESVEIVTVREEVTIIVDASPVYISGGGGSGSNALNITHDAVAAVDLSGHRLVVPQSNDSLVYADSGTVADLALPVWLTTGAIMSGAIGTVTCFGPVIEPSWNWTPGLSIYLGLNGALTQIVPTLSGGFVLCVALAISATEIFYNPQMPIVLA